MDRRRNRKTPSKRYIETLFYTEDMFFFVQNHWVKGAGTPLFISHFHAGPNLCTPKILYPEVTPKEFGAQKSTCGKRLHSCYEEYEKWKVQ